MYTSFLGGDGVDKFLISLNNCEYCIGLAAKYCILCDQPFHALCRSFVLVVYWDFKLGLFVS